MRKDQIRRLGQPVAVTGVGFNELATTLSHTPADLQLSGWAAERAVEFLQLRDRTQPFFLWLSLQDPHPPLTIHEPFYSMYDSVSDPGPVRPRWSGDDEVVPRSLYLQQWGMKVPRMYDAQLCKSRAVYHGMITHMDHQIGRVLGTLQHLGDLDDTVVIYTSDHGEMLGDHRAAKKNCFLEASTRLPFIVRFPAAWKNAHPERVGASSDALLTLADLLPTICEIAGARIPTDVDGASVLPVLQGQTNTHRSSIHGNIDDSHLWKDSEYTYLYFADDGSELLFESEDRENRDLVAARRRTSRGDEALLDEYRGRLAEHLRDESHPHFDEDRRDLLNQRRSRPTEAEALARNQAGLAALGWTEFPLGAIQSLH